jgi:PII-like signaling protein
LKVSGAARVLRDYIGEQDQYKGGPLYAAIVKRFKDVGVAGVTVLHGIEGYGAHRQLHTQRLEVLFQGLPIVIEAIDTPDQIAIVLPVLDEMLTEGLVTYHDAEAIRYLKGN